MDPSPFTQHLDTNYIPTSFEIDTIRGMIDTQRLQVEAIDQKLADLERLRNKLEAQKKDRNEFIAKHYALTTAARSLPDDILSAIFTTFHGLSSPMSSPHPSVVVSHVCRRWRDIALGMPRLWATIEVATPRLSSADDGWYSAWFTSMRLIADRIQMFAERAALYPLIVNLDLEDPDEFMLRYMVEKDDRHPFRDIILAISALAHKQWQSTSISLRIEATISSSIPIITLVSLIRRQIRGAVTFDMTYKHGGRVGHVFWQNMGEINLETMSFTALTILMEDDFLPFVRANWAGLTSLDIGNRNDSGKLSLDLTLKVLASTPNLTTCTIEFPFCVYWESPPDLVSLPQLLSLTVRGGDVPAQFFTRLHLPCLKRLSSLLSVDAVKMVVQNEQRSALVEFTKRYGSQLVELVLDCATITQPALSFVMERLPAVNVLELISCHPLNNRTLGDPKKHPARPERVIQDLTPMLDEQGNVLVDKSRCPNLKELRVGLFEVGPEVKESIASLIEARRSVARIGGPVSWLESVEVRFDEGSSGGILEELAGRGVSTQSIFLGRRSW